MKKSKELKEILVCPTCGKKMIPDKESVIFGTKEWDGHIYKFNCNCLKNKNIRLSVG